MATDTEILEALKSEGIYAISRWREADEAKGRTPVERSLDEWILYIDDYAGRAKRQKVSGDEVEALHTIRKIASLCLNAMRQHGAPKRDDE